MAQLARKLGKRVFAIVGCVSGGADVENLFDEVLPLVRDSISEAESIKHAPELLRKRARELGNKLYLVPSLQEATLSRAPSLISATWKSPLLETPRGWSAHRTFRSCLTNESSLARNSSDGPRPPLQNHGLRAGERLFLRANGPRASYVLLDCLRIPTVTNVSGAFDRYAERFRRVHFRIGRAHQGNFDHFRLQRFRVHIPRPAHARRQAVDGPVQDHVGCTVRFNVKIRGGNPVSFEIDCSAQAHARDGLARDRDLDAVRRAQSLICPDAELSIAYGSGDMPEQVLVGRNAQGRRTCRPCDFIGAAGIDDRKVRRRPAFGGDDTIAVFTNPSRRRAKAAPRAAPR